LIDYPTQEPIKLLVKTKSYSIPMNNEAAEARQGLLFLKKRSKKLLSIWLRA